MEPAVGARVVMEVEDAVHARLHAVVHHRLHAIHPLRVHLIRWRGADVVIPGDGQADGLEARVRHGLNQRLGGLGIAPGRLIGAGRAGAPAQPFAVGVQGVAQVPARTHVRNDLSRQALEHRRLRQGSAHGHHQRQKKRRPFLHRSFLLAFFHHSRCRPGCPLLFCCAKCGQMRPFMLCLYQIFRK